MHNRGRPHHGTSRKPVGFSLVELLVVMAIISILAGLLLPALDGAIDTARTVDCASRLREQYLGFAFFTETNNGHSPPMRINMAYNANGSPNGNYQWSWHAFIANELDGTFRHDLAAHGGYIGFLNMKADDKNLVPSAAYADLLRLVPLSRSPYHLDTPLHCPAALGCPSPRKYCYQPPARGLPTYVPWDDPDGLGRIHQRLSALSSRILWMDSGTNHLPAYPTDGINTTGPDPYPTYHGWYVTSAGDVAYRGVANNWNGQNLTERHNGGSNILFLDGHAQTVQVAYPNDYFWGPGWASGMPWQWQTP